MVDARRAPGLRAGRPGDERQRAAEPRPSLAAAERLARDGVAPVRVAFWGAEELGLYGSRHHVARLGRAARRRIAAYINLDMVGTPGGDAAVYDTDDGIERALRRGLRAAGRVPREEDLGSSSDHAAFRRAGVPVGGVFTGLDDCYHRACDRLGNVDLALVRDVTEAVTRVANGSHRPPDQPSRPPLGRPEPCARLAPRRAGCRCSP